MNTIRFVRFALTAAVLAVGVQPVFATERIYTQSGDSAGFTYFPEGNWSTGNKSFEPGDDVIYRVGSGQVDLAHYIAVTNAHTTFGSLVTTNLDVTLEFAEWRTGAGEINFTDLSDWAGMLWFFRPDVLNFIGGGGGGFYDNPPAPGFRPRTDQGPCRSKARRLEFRRSRHG